MAPNNQQQAQRGMARPSNAELDDGMAQYDGWSVSSEEREAAKPKGDGRYYKFAEGTHQVRVLPWRPDAPADAEGRQSPFLVIPMHYVEVGGKRTGHVCPRVAQEGGKCPTCIAVQMLSTGNALQKGIAEEAGISNDVRANGLVERDGKGAASLWQSVEDAIAFLKILKLPGGVHRKLLQHGAPRKEGGMGVNYIHPLQGQDHLITREGSTRDNTKYEALLDPGGRSAIHEDPKLVKRLLEAMFDLYDDGMEILSYDEIVEKTGLNPRTLKVGTTTHDMAPRRPSAQQALGDGRGQAAAQGRVQQQAQQRRAAPPASAEPMYDDDGNPIDPSDDDKIPF